MAYIHNMRSSFGNETPAEEQWQAYYGLYLAQKCTREGAEMMLIVAIYDLFNIAYFIDII